MKMNLKKQQEVIAASQQVDGEKLHKMMMDRCIPVAKEILKLIVDKDLEIGDGMIQRDQDGKVLPMNTSSRPESYKDVAGKIQQLMLDKDLLWAERHLVFMLVKQPMDLLQNITLTDLEKTYEDGICRMFGIEVLGELSFKQIDDFLKMHSPIHADKVGAN